jgi:hypothetical protein
MEARIKRMESVIIASGLQGSTDPTEVKEEENSFDKIESQAGLGDHLSTLIIDSKGSSNFLGTQEKALGLTCIFVLTLLSRLGFRLLTTFSARTQMDLGHGR